MVGAVFAFWLLISGLAAMLMLGGASAALAWLLASPASHAHHEHVILAIHWGNEPERPIDEALRDFPNRAGLPQAIGMPGCMPRSQTDWVHGPRLGMVA
jgi:hypothetical protein